VTRRLGTSRRLQESGVRRPRCILPASDPLIPHRHARRHPSPARRSRTAHLVPFVEEADHYFLKTIIPSRKATRDYLTRGEDDAQD